MRNEQPLATLIEPKGMRAHVEVIEAEPSWKDFQIKVCKGSNILHMRASALAGFIDAKTGEILDDPVYFIRSLWAKDICDRFGGWPLEILLSALRIEDFGPVTSLAIAR